ncbi:serine hydrolase domain-containing protein [Actinoplanes sp. NBRC 103695]|uniref:serine hydrolase domain-containing protein n=1 Tax=Actinoplanes sp. NBRC 103695 TaxID=3032202 RepID=UPI002554BD48|nr:serine hydrolase domain-containing protein [Actinoplanes sp. NBRC 103695]
MKPIDESPMRRRSVLAALGAVPFAASAAPRAVSDRIPRDTLPGGAYDRYVAGLAAEGRFSGVVLLSHRGRTVLSRSYGMADQERGIRNHEGTAFSLSSAGKPFLPVAVLQLAQRGRLALSDTVGKHLTGFDADIAERVTIHQLLSGTSGLEAPAEDVERVFQSRDEVHEYYVRRARQSKLVGVPGLPTTTHAEPEITIPALIVEAVTGKTYWDYVEENIFRRAGMTGSGFYTRPRWLTDKRLAHPYMEVAGGGRVDAVRNLDQGSPYDYILGKNPGRAFIDAPGDGGFASAPDLVRYAHGLAGGTVLDRPWADVLFAAKLPHGPASFGAYGLAVQITGGQWIYERAGGNPGVGANWSIYPDTGWVGVILSNRDGGPLVEMIGREVQAITGVAPDEGGSGG